GSLVVGKLIDRLGTRVGFALSVFFWSVSAMAHAAAGSILQFAAARFSLGIGEAGSFPGSIKAVAEWFPKKERAIATGIFNSGTNVGAIVTPVVVRWLTSRFGWRMAFIGTGAIGFLWVAAWLALYRRPEESKLVSPAELALIRSDPADPPRPPVPWRTLVTLRQAWAVGLGVGGNSDHARGAHRQRVACRLPSGVGGGGASGMVCQHLHSRFGYVSPRGRSISGWLRDSTRNDWRDGHRENGGLHLAANGI